MVAGLRARKEKNNARNNRHRPHSIVAFGLSIQGRRYLNSYPTRYCPRGAYRPAFVVMRRFRDYDKIVQYLSSVCNV